LFGIEIYCDVIYVLSALTSFVVSTFCVSVVFLYRQVSVICLNRRSSVRCWKDDDEWWLRGEVLSRQLTWTGTCGLSGRRG